jgi:hypothetical protein
MAENVKVIDWEKVNGIEVIKVWNGWIVKLYMFEHNEEQAAYVAVFPHFNQVTEFIGRWGGE